MKKMGEAFAIVFVLTIILSAVIVIIITGNRASHTHYVCLEINPRVEFLTDSKHKVKSLKPLNQQAKELLIDEEFIGLSMEDATTKFLDLCARSGYLRVDGSNNAVKLSVLSGLNQSLEQDLASTINKFFVNNNILGVVVESSQDLQAYKDAKKHGVNFEKYDLMMAVQESQPNASIDELKKLNNKQLIEKIEQSHNEYVFDYTESELANKVALIDFYREVYDKHEASITNETTREFKTKLKEFKAENTKDYKVDYNKKYNEWLIG